MCMWYLTNPCISHCVFHISLWHLGYSVIQHANYNRHSEPKFYQKVLGSVCSNRLQPITTILPQISHQLEGAVSTTSFAASAVQDTFAFGLEWNKECVIYRPIPVSATVKIKVVIYCTLHSLQMHFLLSEKSMRQNPHPWTHTTFQGLRSPCIMPTLWRSCNNLYTWGSGRSHVQSMWGQLF